MKQITFVGLLLVCASMFATAGYQYMDDVQPNQKIINALHTKYPAASDIEWELKHGYYVAEFQVKNIDMEAWFDQNGIWQMTKSDISFNALPQTVKTNFLNSEYQKWKREDVDKLERTNMEAVYIIEIEKNKQEIDLYYIENGTLVKKSTNGKKGCYLPVKNTIEIKSLVRTKFPQATILNIESEKDHTEVDILDGQTKKELLFDNKNQWISTTWEIHKSDVPENIFQALKNSEYGQFHIDDIEYQERARGINVYIFDVEKNDQEYYITINAINGSIISTIAH